jgi:lysophospholipase L1-like esterase
MSHECRRVLGTGVLGLVLAACSGSPSTPTPPPPPVPDPPTITCPASLTVQAVDDNPTVVNYGSPTVANGSAPVVTACTPPNGSGFPVSQTAVMCTATDALSRTSTCSFSVTVLPVPMLAATNLLAFGDSITWGEDGLNSLAASLKGPTPQRTWPTIRVPLPQTYPEVLRQSLAQRYTKQTPSVSNYGLTGEILGDPATLSRYVSLTSSGRFDAVLIMEGSNDLADRDDTVVPAAVSNLRQMVGDAKSRGIRPYLATIPPQDPAGWRGGGAELVPGFNDRVRALASDESVPLVDVYKALNGDLAVCIGPDGLHPTVQGYAKIADTFFVSIQATLESTPPAVAATPAMAPAGRARSRAAPSSRQPSRGQPSTVRR